MVYIEKLAKTKGELVQLSFDLIKSEIEIAKMIACSDDFSKAFVEKGDVILVNNKFFLVEEDLSVTEMEQDEYAYYKNIDVEERISRWFAEA